MEELYMSVKVTMEELIAFRNNGDFFSGHQLPLKGAYKLSKIRKQLRKKVSFIQRSSKKLLMNMQYGSTI